MPVRKTSIAFRRTESASSVSPTPSVGHHHHRHADRQQQSASKSHHRRRSKVTKETVETDVHSSDSATSSSATSDQHQRGNLKRKPAEHDHSDERQSGDVTRPSLGRDHGSGVHNHHQHHSRKHSPDSHHAGTADELSDGEHIKRHHRNTDDERSAPRRPKTNHRSRASDTTSITSTSTAETLASDHTAKKSHGDNDQSDEEIHRNKVEFLNDLHAKVEARRKPSDAAAETNGEAVISKVASASSPEEGKETAATATDPENPPTSITATPSATSALNNVDVEAATATATNTDDKKATPMSASDTAAAVASIQSLFPASAERLQSRVYRNNHCILPVFLFELAAIGGFGLLFVYLRFTETFTLQETLVDCGDRSLEYPVTLTNASTNSVDLIKGNGSAAVFTSLISNLQFDFSTTGINKFQVPIVALYLLTMIVPLVLIIVGEISFWLFSSASKTIRAHFALIRLPLFLRRLIRHTGIFIFGYFITSIIIDAIKLTLARPRPYFLAACMLAECGAMTPSMRQFAPATIVTIESPDSTECESSQYSGSFLRDARMSFPSFYAGIAAYSTLFCAVYLHNILSNTTARVIKSTLIFGLLGIGAFVACTRTLSHRNHVVDVMFGALVGYAIGIYLSIFVLNCFHESAFFVIGGGRGTGINPGTHLLSYLQPQFGALLTTSLLPPSTALHITPPHSAPTQVPSSLPYGENTVQQQHKQLQVPNDGQNFYQHYMDRNASAFAQNSQPDLLNVRRPSVSPATIYGVDPTKYMLFNGDQQNKAVSGRHQAENIANSQQQNRNVIFPWTNAAVVTAVPTAMKRNASVVSVRRATVRTHSTTAGSSVLNPVAVVPNDAEFAAAAALTNRTVSYPNQHQQFADDASAMANGGGERSMLTDPENNATAWTFKLPRVAYDGPLLVKNRKSSARKRHGQRHEAPPVSPM